MFVVLLNTTTSTRVKLWLLLPVVGPQPPSKNLGIENRNLVVEQLARELA